MFSGIQKLRNVFRFGVLSVLGLAVSGCDISLPSGGGQQQFRPVNVSLMVPQSAGGGLTAISASMVNAARMAIAENPDVSVNLMVLDTGGNPAQGRSLAQTARNSGADIVVGPLFATVANEVGLEMARTDTAVLTASNTSSIAGANVFVMGTSFDATAERLVSFAASRGMKSVMSLTASDVPGADAAAAVQRSATRQGLRFDGASRYALTQEGLAQGVVKASQAQSANGTEAVALSANASGALPILGELIPATGLNQRAKLLGMARWDVPSATLRIPALQNGWFTVPDFAAAQNFNARYAARFGSQPDQTVTPVVYDAMLTVIEQARSKGISGLTPAELAKGKTIKGAQSSFTLQPSRIVNRGLAVAEVTNGTYRIISPAPTSFGRVGF